MGKALIAKWSKTSNSSSNVAQWTLITKRTTTLDPGDTFGSPFTNISYLFTALSNEASLTNTYSAFLISVSGTLYTELDSNRHLLHVRIPGVPFSGSTDGLLNFDSASMENRTVQIPIRLSAITGIPCVDYKYLVAGSSNPSTTHQNFTSVEIYVKHSVYNGTPWTVRSRSTFTQVIYGIKIWFYLPRIGYKTYPGVFFIYYLNRKVSNTTRNITRGKMVTHLCPP